MAGIPCRTPPALKPSWLTVLTLLVVPTAASPTWLMPANGVPMSGAESEATCQSIGQRLCTYDELCPRGSGSPALDMPPDHTAWMPYKDLGSDSRRWIGGDCGIHESSYGPECHTPGCDTTMCSTECCSHGWCTIAENLPRATCNVEEAPYMFFR